MPFSFLSNTPEILKSLSEAGYVKPTPIQEAAIPKILEGCDLLASAQTGSGKTAAFLLPALHKVKMHSAEQSSGPKILILVPTRELAMQVAGQAKKYSKYMNRVTTVCLYGGAPYPVQNRQLSRPYEILVATPGRLIDHLERGRIDFSQVKMLVLDEADRMLDMGFLQPVERIASELPSGVQTVMFSATFEKGILKLANKLLKDPCQIQLAQTMNKHENIDQSFYFADNLRHKLRLLDHLLPQILPQQTIIFTATKSFAEELGGILRDNGVSVGVLHGDLQQRRRTSTIKKLREGEISVLVATDVAARGIDIPTIQHVINLDLSKTTDDYIHRIGRTGRADAKGSAYSFVLPQERYLLKQLEEHSKQELSILTIPGLEPTINEQRKEKHNRGPAKRNPGFKKGNKFAKPASSRPGDRRPFKGKRSQSAR